MNANAEQLEAVCLQATKTLAAKAPDCAVMVVIYPRTLKAAVMTSNMPKEVRLDFVRGLLAQMEADV